MMVKSQDPRVRIAIIHCMADLLRRFPNEADPYSPNLYKWYVCIRMSVEHQLTNLLFDSLKDPEEAVRREGLVVLSKLILGDMLRVKFQISYLAACLTDPDPCCQGKIVVSIFFTVYYHVNSVHRYCELLFCNISHQGQHSV